MAAKIMLVEDDINLSEIYKARLEAEGFNIISAKDGEEALAIAVKEHPNLIISDIMMPKISGFDMLDILRGTEGIKNTKVIMMTALGQAEDKERATKLGADRYLVKSQVTLEDVVKAVHEVLGDQTNAEDTAFASAPSAPAIQPPNPGSPPPATPEPSSAPTPASPSSPATTSSGTNTSAEDISTEESAIKSQIQDFINQNAQNSQSSATDSVANNDKNKPDETKDEDNSGTAIPVNIASTSTAQDTSSATMSPSDSKIINDITPAPQK